MYFDMKFKNKIISFFIGLCLFSSGLLLINVNLPISLVMIVVGFILLATDGQDVIEKVMNSEWTFKK